VRTLDHGAEARLAVHVSALRLLLHDETYRPANLLDHLAAHPAALDAPELKPEAREELAAIVRQHAGGAPAGSASGGAP
jgi:hypothetical protein